MLFEGPDYPSDYLFKTDNSFMSYPVMGNMELDIDFSYSLKFKTDTLWFKLLFVKLLLGALIPRYVGLSVGPPKITKEITKLYKTLK